jgi:hypothetical protein
VCQWQATLFDLGAPGSTNALNAGRWAGDPRRASCHRHVAGQAPLPPQGRHVVAPDPLPGGGVRAPEADWSGQARDGLAITRGGPGPSWGVWVRGGYPRAPLPSWARGGPGHLRARGRSEDHGPSCQAPGRTPRHPEDEGEITDGENAKGLDTLAEGTPVPMYRH